MENSQDIVHVGIDIGSTTTKYAVVDPASKQVLARDYRRHGAQQALSVRRVLEQLESDFAHAELHMAMTGSGAANIANALGVPFVQEVVANSIAIRRTHPEVRCAIELGGQDAKMIFLRENSHTGELEIADMRMNGSCAGGTGAFVDEIASVLETPVEQFDALASRGQHVYSISGRCGVYAKTDIQPLLNQGVPRADLALSAMHAIAKQTIGGLAQGLDIEPPVIFEGGPLTFNPTLIRVFAERLGLGSEQVVVPQHAETMVAYGAALAIEALFARRDCHVDVQAAIQALADSAAATGAASAALVLPLSGGAAEHSEAERVNASSVDSAVFNPLSHACGVTAPPERGSTKTGEPAPATSASHAGGSTKTGEPAPTTSTSPHEGSTKAGEPAPANAFFASAAERAAFEARHALPTLAPANDVPELAGRTLRCYLGIDSGSTTTKYALIGEDEQLLDSFYANNEGKPLDVATAALKQMRERYRAAGITLDIVAAGTCGYGEMLFNRAFHTESHTVETVAHAAAATKYLPQASFILDIGGQDMKAIWLDNGVVTQIMVNEACSSGCGSFLENFANSLHIPTHEIAHRAFAAQSPAKLGSRCTVFMNSSIVTEQKNGKTPSDIMAGLCRSIIENVFTKVVRISNVDSLGDHIVVQGGTFMNDAVLRALEDYLGKEVTRAPYPGLMGAIGAALIAKREAATAQAAGSFEPSFIGLAALDGFAYREQSNVTCPWCGNHCNRTLVTFADGSTFVTGNRCPKGEVVEDPQSDAARARVKRIAQQQNSVPNLFTLREKLLFQDWPHPTAPTQRERIGLPRVLGFWDRMPFWKTLLQSLGFTVVVSHPSTRSMYEDGLHAVASDTVCFPAKLVHGHLRDLAEQGVDRIFYPTLTTVPSENAAKTSESMCAVVKGYPIVIRNSDNPERWGGVTFDNPLWHWYTHVDRERQLATYFAERFGIGASEVRTAIHAADAAMHAFHTQLLDAGKKLINQVEEAGSYALVLASRPYHNDALVNHGLPEMFAELGVPVMPPDAVPHATEVDLSRSLIDIVNNFHARMLSTAVLAAESDCLEYAQVVSFGCGHDAYLSDEIIRLMHLAGDKTPLVMKVDESDNAGPLRIRVRSFIETLNAQRAKAGEGAAHLVRDPSTPGAQSTPSAQDDEGKGGAAKESEAEGVNASNEGSSFSPLSHGCAVTAPPDRGSTKTLSALPDPYPQKFTADKIASYTVLVPNTSHLFSRMMAAVFEKQGLNTVSLPIGRERAIALGKQYVHNDICFPAQIVIGEILAELETGKYDLDHVAVANGKYVGDCRLTHYAALTRKALDDAGYTQVPILTNDDVDAHNMQPGWKMNLASAVRIAFTLPMIDILEELLRKTRPYEKEPGAANAAFERASDELIEGLRTGGVAGAKRGFKRAVKIMDAIACDRSRPRPTVLIVGEYLLNFHPGANNDVELFLEKNGLEVIEARMTDVIRKTYFYKHAQVKEYKVDKPLSEKTWYAVADNLFELAHDTADRIAKAARLYSPAKRMGELVKASDTIIHHTFDAGEGVLIPGEILHHAEQGCRAFVILQPFGCLPNHIVGRGIAKKLKELYPDAQVLPLDYDPDVSFANVENRLQMLIMNTLGGQAA